MSPPGWAAGVLVVVRRPGAQVAADRVEVEECGAPSGPAAAHCGSRCSGTCARCSGARAGQAAVRFAAAAGPCATGPISCAASNIPTLTRHRREHHHIVLKPAGWHPDYFRTLLEREHRARDLADGRIGDRRRGLFEHEQPRSGDLARERFAVADREERVAATVHDKRRDRELG